MAKTVGARINEDVAEWLEEYAEKQKTTKARIVENQILQLYEAQSEPSESAEIRVPENIEDRPDEVEGSVIYFDDHDEAEEFRNNFGQSLAERDDKRLNDAYVKPVDSDTREEILNFVQSLGY